MQAQHQLLAYINTVTIAARTTPPNLDYIERSCKQLEAACRDMEREIRNGNS